MTSNDSFIAGIKDENDHITYVYESINKDLKECIQTQLKLMKKHNVIKPMYVTICKYDARRDGYLININFPIIEVKYCANCFRQVDANDLDDIEIIDGMCFHKEDC